MAWKNKVIWSEGMLMQPQHLQQHDRYWQSHLEARVSALRPYSWGYSALKIDEQQLALGKLSLQQCNAVLPDGTPVCLPAEDDLPLPLAIPVGARNVLVMLALPLRRPGVNEVDNTQGPDNFARYRHEDYECWDSNGLDNSALMQIGKLRLCLALESDVANAYTTLAIAKVIERRSDGQVVLDPDFCPACLDYHVAPRLSAFVDELVGLLHQRGEALAARLSQTGGNGAAEIADFLLLQMLNRVEPLFIHLSGMANLHPEELYRAMLTLAGELATFTDSNKRTTAYPPYIHDRLIESFAPLMRDLRKSLSTVLDSQAVAIPLEERQYGIRVAVLADKTLLKSASFVLAVGAQVVPEVLRTGFPMQIKIGSIEQIRDLVNLQLPGIGLRPMAVAPRQLPFYAGFVYFELDSSSEYWQPLSNSAGFAMHVVSEFPGLQMQFWAIRR
ncbi:MAG: type secretion system baseplate subunit TssK [Pseudomonadota bacterium]